VALSSIGMILAPHWRVQCPELRQRKGMWFESSRSMVKPLGIVPVDGEIALRNQ
jgi:hypothetical protein